MKKKQNKKSFWRSPKFRRGGLATLFTVGFIAIVLLLNIVVSAVNTRFPLTVDMTAAGAFTLSDETADYLKSVDEPVEIDLCSSENVYATSSEPVSYTHLDVYKRQISSLHWRRLFYLESCFSFFCCLYPASGLPASISCRL